MVIFTEDLARSYPVAVGVATAEQWPTEPGEGVDCAALMCEAARAAVVDTLTGLGRPLLRRRHPDGDGIRPGEILREDHHQAGRVRSNRSVAWEYQLPA